MILRMVSELGATMARSQQGNEDLSSTAAVNHILPTTNEELEKDPKSQMRSQPELTLWFPPCEKEPSCTLPE